MINQRTWSRSFNLLTTLLLYTTFVLGIAACANSAPVAEDTAPVAPTSNPQSTTPVPPQPTQTTQDTQFLHTRGADILYRDKTIVLKGTNFDNIPALGANIGTGNVDDIAYDETDYAELRRQGANHVRFGLSYNWYEENESRFFQKLDQHVVWAEQHGIWLLFTLFTTPGDCYEGYATSCPLWGSKAEQQQLVDFWTAMATRYRDSPAVAGYDLLNEPVPAAGCDQWFDLAGRVRDGIAAVAPNQLVFIESCSDPINDLQSSALPRGQNIVYEVHDYAPMDMSHDMYSPGSVYPGNADEWYGSCYYDKAAFASGNSCPQANLREVYGLDWAERNNVPIYVGEWGATSRLTGYVQYHQDKAELYRDWNVHHAHYTWKHQTIKTGGEYQWGIYSSPLNLDDPAKLNAVKIAWQGAIHPDALTPAP